MALIKISQLPPGDSDISPSDMLPFVNSETLQTKKLTVQGLEDYLNVPGLVDSAIQAFDQSGRDHDSARTQSQIDSAIGALTTTVIPEGTNLYYTDARVTSLVDSAYVSARVEADLTLDVLDSAEAIQLINETVDSAYVNALVDFPGGDDGHDSARVQGQIDSAVGALTTSDIPEGSNLYYTDARVTTLVDSAYVSARVEADLTLDVLDSAEAIQLINETVDSAYVQARVTLDGTHDSALTLQQITSTVDSAYVQARVTLDGTHDSARTQSQIDSSASNYLQTTAYGFDNTVDSATINKLTIGGPDSDDAKLYFDTVVSVHELEAVEGGGVDMSAWIGYPSSNQSNHWNSVTYGNGKFVAVANSGSNRVMYSEDGTDWTGVTSSDESIGWSDVTYGNGKFVAVRATGNDLVMYSTDGINWTGVPDSDNSEYWVSVTYGNGKFVAVRDFDSDRVMYSTDGINWTTTASSNESNYWYSVTYGDGKFVAVGGVGSNLVMYSTDGINWTGATSANESNEWVSVTYGNGKFVAVSPDGSSNNVMYSEDGINWTGVTTEPNEWYSVTYGNGKFVAVAGGGTNLVMYSEDGINWTDVPSSNESNGWNTVTYGDGKFVAVAGYGTNRVMVLEAPEDRAGLFYDGALIATRENLTPLIDRVNELSDGVQEGWDSAQDLSMITSTVDSAYVQARVSSSNYLQTTAYGFDNTVDSASINKLTVGPDSADDSKLYFETGAGTHVLEGREAGAVDMHAWVSYDIPGGNKGWSGVAYGNGKWVAVAQNFDERVAYSTDGIEWTLTNAGIQAGWSEIIYDGSKFVALAIMAASTGENIMTSTDGVTWNSSDTYTLPGTLANWTGLAYGDGKYVAVANNRQIAYSTNGTSWTLQTAPHASGSYYGVSYGDGQFVLVGSSGNVATSSDGQTWTSRTASTSAGWNDVAYGNDLWVAISADAPNRVMYSSDGAVTWTDAPQYAVFENAWEAITFGDGKFVAVARNNSQRLMWSTNGVSWTAKTIPYNFWADISYANNRFVGVSQGTSNHVITLDHDADKEGLFYDGELVATTENLRPLFDKLNQISTDFDAAQLDFSNLQDSAGGLATGKLYRDSDTIRVVL